MASSSSLDAEPAAAEPAAEEVPPLPPKLRPRPQESSIGDGGCYADEAAFLADCRAWEAEERQRKEQVKERECAQQQIRDRGRPARKRSERSRGPNDNAQRVQRRRAANPRLLPPEVVQAFADLGDGDCSTILVRGQGAHPRCICGWAPSTSVVVRFPECWSR